METRKKELMSKKLLFFTPELEREVNMKQSNLGQIGTNHSALMSGINTPSEQDIHNIFNFSE